MIRPVDPATPVGCTECPQWTGHVMVPGDHASTVPLLISSDSHR